jgi:CrcB protein
MSYLIVFVGGGIGAAMRHAINRAALAVLGASFPFGTLIVNILGSFLMGVLAVVLLARAEGDQSLRLFLATGILGGYTTFSAFSLEAALMWEKAQWLSLGSYVIGSVALSIGALFVGMVAARSFS